MTSFIPLFIVTSLYEVFIEGIEYDYTFHTFSHWDLTVWSIYWRDGVRWYFSYLFSLWPPCMKYVLSGYSTMTPFTPFLIVISLYEVLVEGMEHDDIFHSSAHCDLTVWSIYWGDGVWWHLSYFFSLWPHCMNYLLKGWSMMTSYILLLIVKSLYEVFIKVMEYDNTFHITAHCDLTVCGICWGNGGRWHLSHLFSLWPQCMRYLSKFTTQPPT